MTIELLHTWHSPPASRSLLSLDNKTLNFYKKLGKGNDSSWGSDEENLDKRADKGETEKERTPAVSSASFIT